jgi:hypothetical protein
MEILGYLRRSTLIETAEHFGFADEFLHKSMFVWPDISYASSIWNVSLGMPPFNERVL